MTQDTPLAALVTQLCKLPGVGPKSAQRMAFHLLGLPVSEVETFASVIATVRRTIRYCQDCFYLTNSHRCRICDSPKRHNGQLCVVADPRDVASLERSGTYQGVYHVLGGLISPLDGRNPDTLRIPELKHRLGTGAFQEVVLAINPTIEGEATIHYLASLLGQTAVTVSRLASGLPIGADLEFADELTLTRAFIERVGIK
ncbi:recombination protein RecR [bacterium]|nr:recombination protein RecR [bacterium]